MKTAKIIKLDRELLRNRDQAVKAIGDICKEISKGGIVIMPTDTAYGIAADATNEDAVKKVFEIKNRDESKAIPIIVSDMYMIKEYAEISPLAEYLAREYMPGPLSLIVPQKADGKLAKTLSAKGVAFRVPSNEFARALVSECSVPLTATSANISGDGPIYNIDEIKMLFQNKAQVIIDGGNLVPTPPSTIIDLQESEPKVIREGPISSVEILRDIAEFKAKNTA